MNTLRTDHGAYEYHMPRARYRELLIASQVPKAPHHYDLDKPSTLIELAELTVFAAGMLALLGYGLMWILG